MGAECLPAVDTPMRPLFHVDSELMDPHAAAGREAFPADRTGEGSSSAVDPQVSHQVGSSGETAAADAAAERPSLAGLGCLRRGGFELGSGAVYRLLGPDPQVLVLFQESPQLM